MKDETINPRIEFFTKEGRTEIILTNIKNGSEESALATAQMRHEIDRVINLSRFVVTTIDEGAGKITYNISDPRFLLTQEKKESILAIVQSGL